MGKRGYELGSRAEAMRVTRERILDVAEEQFAQRWFEDVTMADLARGAGVSTQTVVNHFGTKEQLYRAGIAERVAPTIQAVRSQAVPGDLASIVDVACDDYEATGDGTIRLVAMAARSEDLAAIVAGGRTAHRAWVEHCFAPWLDELAPAQRERRVTLLTTLLDASTWHTLRRVEGLSRAETGQALRDMIEPLLDRTPTPA